MAPGMANSKSNVLPLWGNDKTMNLNNLILTNIQSSHYFKVNLFELKTYHEVIDEIYYKVSHLEPWEKGSRKTSGQTGMCGGVRGVGAGGIVSTAFCLLYKLFTLKLTRKQVNGLITHCDSPYIRALGFMYIRYTQPPADLWDWFEPYLEDEEELDVKAGQGCKMCIGEMLRHFLTKLEWFSTLFPRIPVPIQKDIERKLNALGPSMMPCTMGRNKNGYGAGGGIITCGTADVGMEQSDSHSPTPPSRNLENRERHIPDEEVSWGEAERIARLRRSASREKRLRKEDSGRHGSERRNGERRDRDRGRETDDYGRDRTRRLERDYPDDKDGDRRHCSREQHKHKEGGQSHSRERKHRFHRSRSREHHHRRHKRSRSRSPDHSAS